MMKRATSRGLTALATAALLLGVAACGTDSGGNDTSSGTPGSKGFTPPDVPMQDSIGDMEGQVNILAWPGYAEDGSTDKSVDWVTPFEQASGCNANVKYFATSDEAIQLMKTGEYDVVSASGDATLRLIAAGDVAPVNTDLVKNYADISPFLKDQGYNSVNGQMYGIPHGWGANLLMYNTEKVSPAPTSWSAVFDDASQYAGKVTAYDSPIYIADAALYLMNTQPDLGIKDPYALDTDQLAAAVDLLKKQKENVSEYWSDYLKEIQAFKTGDTEIGTTWQVIASLAKSEGAPVEAFLPEEGSTGWSDTWMISSQAKHPNCMYLWMNHVISPETNAEIAQWFGEAPAQSNACDTSTLTAAAKNIGLAPDPKFCQKYHAEDPAFWSRVYYWNTPVSDCSVVDQKAHSDQSGSGDDCKDYNDWLQAWTEIKG
jgi:putative spermidine/putrescine transport system substrate-binding protein